MRSKLSQSRFLLSVKRRCYRVMLSGQSYQAIEHDEVRGHRLLSQLVNRTWQVEKQEEVWEEECLDLSSSSVTHYAMTGRFSVSHTELQSLMAPLKLSHVPIHKLRNADLLFVGRGGELKDGVREQGVWEVSEQEVERLIHDLQSYRSLCSEEWLSTVDLLAEAYLQFPDHSFPFAQATEEFVDDELLINEGVITLYSSRTQGRLNSKQTDLACPLPFGGSVLVKRSLVNVESALAFIVMWRPLSRRAQKGVFGLPHDIIPFLLALSRSGRLPHLWILSSLAGKESQREKRWNEELNKWQELHGPPLTRIELSTEAWSNCEATGALPVALLEQSVGEARVRQLGMDQGSGWRAIPPLTVRLSELVLSAQLLPRLGIVNARDQETSVWQLPQTWVLEKPISGFDLLRLYEQFPYLEKLMLYFDRHVDWKNDVQTFPLFNAPQAFLICDALNIATQRKPSYLDEEALNILLHQDGDPSTLLLRRRKRNVVEGLRLPSMIEREAWFLSEEYSEVARNSVSLNKPQVKSSLVCTELSLGRWGLYQPTDCGEWTHDDPFEWSLDIPLTSTGPYDPDWSSVIHSTNQVGLNEIRPLAWSPRHSKWSPTIRRALLRLIHPLC